LATFIESDCTLILLPSKSKIELGRFVLVDHCFYFEFLPGAPRMWPGSQVDPTLKLTVDTIGEADVSAVIYLDL